MIRFAAGFQAVLMPCKAGPTMAPADGWVMMVS
jgi:hypothetical protein